jgi:hypothetical protein
MNEELTNWLSKQLREFENDLVESEANDLPLDYAYAEGAYNAYEFMLKKLQEITND